MTLKPSSQASVSMLTKRDLARFCPSSPVKLSTMSSQKDAKNLLLFHLVAALSLLEVLPLVVPLKKHQKRKKRNQKQRATPETTTWDSAFSTKKWKTRTHTEQRSWIFKTVL